MGAEQLYVCCVYVCLSVVYLISNASSASVGVQACLLVLCSMQHMQMTCLHCSWFSSMSFVP